MPSVLQNVKGLSDYRLTLRASWDGWNVPALTVAAGTFGPLSWNETELSINFPEPYLDRAVGA